MKNRYFSIPAKVKYIGEKTDQLTPGKIYDAFFLEYWQGIRNSLHILDDTDAISNFHPLEYFEIIEDTDNVLSQKEAIVQCITNKYEKELLCIKMGKKYKAIGCDRNGLYLVMDESLDCYFYPPDYFIILKDEHGILERESIYYSYK